MRVISFKVPGLPHGKGRPRVAVRGGHARVYTPQKTASYESLVKMAGHMAMGEREPVVGPVYVVLTATFPIPASWSKKKQAEVRTGCMWHTGKPDADNIMKTMDALNGVVWKDDSQVALSKVQKLYGCNPGLDVLVEVLL